jgi:hypothetical protein
MPTVMETISSSIERMKDEASELRAKAVALDSDIEQHYGYLGRKYYERERQAAA